MERRKLLIGGGAAAAIGVAAWVGLRRRGGGSSPISLRLAWLPGATFIGDYAAIHTSSWKTRGLDISLKPGGFEFDAIRLVAAGSDQFGVTSGPQLIQARAQGIPIVAIGSTIPRSPIGWVSHLDSGIVKPQDFRGKRIGAQFGTHTEVTFEALMAKLSIPLSAVERVPVKFDPALFLTKQIDVLPVYLIDQPIEFDSNGVKTNRIDPFDYDVGLNYGNLYFTTERLLKDSPDVVSAFVDGARDGWVWAHSHQNEAAELLAAAAPTVPQALHAAKADATFRFIAGKSEYRGIYPVSISGLLATAELLKTYGKLEGNPSEFLKAASIAL